MSLLSVIKRSPEVRRLFGQRELAILEKQLLGVRLTQSEKNRLSRSVRKKLAAVAALAPFAAEFNLKKGAEISRIIEETKEIILESPLFSRITEIILYGSAADGTLTLASDIDLAVKFTDISDVEAGRFRVHVLGRADKRVDVQVYNVLPQKIQREIDMKGKVIYERTHPR